MAKSGWATCPRCGKRKSVASQPSSQSVRCDDCKQEFTPSTASVAAMTQVSDASETKTADPRSSSPPVIGKLGRFDLHSVIGSGAFGVVYRATDPTLKRRVALKIPKVDVTSSSRSRRFFKESQAAARLHHPNIVAIYDAGRIDDEQAYIAFEFVEGWTLTNYLEQKSPSLRLLMTWLRDLANGLAYAHQEGIVHRDIKPDNILVDRAQLRPKIADFGLARIADDEESLHTQEGSILGTPAYMAPEQARGDLQRIGPLSDLYSLGSVMFEVITGQRPYRGGTLGILGALVSKADSPSVLTIKPETPRDLAAICQRAMQKDPARRYQDCQEFAEDLSRWLAGAPVAARPVSLVSRFGRWVRRNPLISGLIMTVVTVLVTALIVVTLALSVAKRDRALAVTEEERAKRFEADAKNQARLAEQRAAEAELLAYRPNIMLAQRELLGSRVQKARTWMEACLPRSRGWEWRYLNERLRPKLLSRRPERCFVETNQSDVRGREPLTSLPDGQSFLMDIDGIDFGQFSFTDGRLLRRFARSTTDPTGPEWIKVGVLRFAVAPDGKSVVTLANQFRLSPRENRTQLTLWDMTSGRMLDQHNFVAQGNAPMSSYRHLLANDTLSQVVLIENRPSPTASNDGSPAPPPVSVLHYYKVNSAKLEKDRQLALPAEVGHVEKTSRLPYRKTVAIQCSQSQSEEVRILDLESGQIVETVTGPPLQKIPNLWNGSFDYDERTGRLIMFDAGLIACREPDRQTYRYHRLHNPSAATTQSECLFSADARSFVTWEGHSRKDSLVRVWGASPTSPGQELTLISEFPEIPSPLTTCLSSDGRRAVTVGDETVVWAVEDYAPAPVRSIPGFETPLGIDEQSGTFVVSTVKGIQRFRLTDGEEVGSPIPKVGDRYVVECRGAAKTFGLRSRAGAIEILDSGDGKQLASWTVPAPDSTATMSFHGPNQAIAASADRKFFAVPIDDRRLAVFDGAGKERWSIQVDADEMVSHARFVAAGDEGWLACTRIQRTQGNSPGVWDLTQFTTSFLKTEDFATTSTISKMAQVMLSPDGRWMLGASSLTSDLELMELSFEKDRVQEQTRRPLGIAPRQLKSAAFLPDGDRLILGLHDGRLIVFDTSAAGEILELQQFEAPVDFLLVSQTARYIVAGVKDRYHVFDSGRGPAP